MDLIFIFDKKPEYLPLFEDIKIIFYQEHFLFLIGVEGCTGQVRSASNMILFKGNIPLSSLEFLLGQN
jgi:hypothetical protein